MPSGCTSQTQYQSGELRGWSGSPVHYREKQRSDPPTKSRGRQGPKDRACRLVSVSNRGIHTGRRANQHRPDSHFTKGLRITEPPAPCRFGAEVIQRHLNTFQPILEHVMDEDGNHCYRVLRFGHSLSTENQLSPTQLAIVHGASSPSFSMKEAACIRRGGERGVWLLHAKDGNTHR